MIQMILAIKNWKNAKRSSRWLLPTSNPDAAFVLHAWSNMKLNMHRTCWLWPCAIIFFSVKSISFKLCLFNTFNNRYSHKASLEKCTTVPIMRKWQEKFPDVVKGYKSWEQPRHKSMRLNCIRSLFQWWSQLSFNKRGNHRSYGTKW